MTEREFFKTFYDKDSLNTKSNKTIFVKNAIMTNTQKHYHESIEHKVK